MQAATPPHFSFFHTHNVIVDYLYNILIKTQVVYSERQVKDMVRKMVC